MRPARFHRQLFLTLGLSCAAATWWGCAKGSGESGTTNTSLSSSSSGAGGGEGTGGGIHFDGGAGGGGTGGACSSTSAAAHRVPLDLVFLMDESNSMSIPTSKWASMSASLTSFFSDPASAGIGAGMLAFPLAAYDCDVTHYETLQVPIAALPANGFALTNALPAECTIHSTPMYGALQGALSIATAYQDANPTHKVNVVLATDGNTGVGGEPGDPMVCGGKGYNEIAALATSALGYNGVHTYVIAVPGADLTKLNQVAEAGGTTTAYDVTQNIDDFSAQIAAIRNQALGCDFQLPKPPHGKELNSDEVNVNYTPNGMGSPKLLPRAQNKADCHGKPGWYYDDNSAPTEVILCPSSCSTVQNDQNAKIDVLFGCSSIQN